MLSILLHWSSYSQQPYMVKDIYPGYNSSLDLPYITPNNNSLFFGANNGTNGLELWKSDGTNAGTVMIKDIFSGNGSGTGFNIPPVNINGILYFVGNNGIDGTELWKSDGTEIGTVMVKDINALNNSSNPGSLTNVNGVLYFRANDGINGHELWKSDGTANGTIMVKDIYPGNNLNGTPNNSFPYSLTNVNGTLFFAAGDAINGTELWKSDGTTAGTVMVSNAPGTESTIGGLPNMTNVNGILFFAGVNNAIGVELWKSDGTNLGTVLVKDIFPGNNAFYANSSEPYSLTNVNGTLFFSACDSEIDSNNQNFELWKSDGTTAGTVKVKEIRAGINGSIPRGLANANGFLYFVANDGINGKEIWKSDGTEAGTTLIKDLYAGVGSSDPYEFTYINGVTYFVANDGIIGRQIFKTDGTANGTVGINILNLTGDAPSNLINVNEKLFFTASVGAYGKELWVLNTTLLSTSTNITNENKLSIFPNPVNNILNIQNVDNKLIDKVTISDLTGKKVLEQNNNSNIINVENLQKGMYLLQIFSGEKNVVSKFIKN